MPTSNPGETLFILYDERAEGGDTEGAAVLCTARSLKEARRDAKDYGRCAIYAYDISGKELTNERFIEARG